MATSSWQQKRPTQDDGGPANTGDAMINRDERSTSAGAALRQAREEMGWDIKQVGQTLKIRPEYLDAFERNSLEGLPGPAYAMGFLKTYADFLGLDTGEIVRRFKAEKSGLGRRPELTFPVPLTDRGIPGSGLFLIALILIALGYGTWYYMSSGRHSTPPAVEPVPAQLLNPLPPSANQNAVADNAPAPGAATVPVPATGSPASVKPETTNANLSGITPPLQGSTGQVQLTAPGVAPTTPQGMSTAALAQTNSPNPPSPDSNVPASGSQTYGLPTAGHIVLHASAASWVQVKENGSPIFTRVLKAGDSYNVPDRPGLTMRTGNAGGIEITADGKTLPPLGALGQVKGNIQLDPAKLASPAEQLGKHL